MNDKHTPLASSSLCIEQLSEWLAELCQMRRDFSSWLAIPMNQQGSEMVLGGVISRRAAVYSGSVRIPLASIKCPRKFTCLFWNSHTSLLRITLNPLLPAVPRFQPLSALGELPSEHSHLTASSPHRSAHFMTSVQLPFLRTNVLAHQLHPLSVGSGIPHLGFLKLLPKSTSPVCVTSTRCRSCREAITGRPSRFLRQQK